MAVHLNVHILPDAGSRRFVVSGVTEYVAARVAIEDSLTSVEGAEIWVAAGPWSGWFWDLEQIAQVEMSDEDPRRSLASLLGRTGIPADLTPKVILSLGLLALPRPMRPIVEVWDWIIAQKLGLAWTEKDSSWQHFRRLIESCLSVPGDALSRGPLADRADKLLAEWANKAQGRLQSAYRMAQRDPVALAVSLAALVALRNYPSDTACRWCREEGIDTADAVWLSEEIGELPLQPDFEHRLSSKALAYWNARLPDQDTTGVLGCLAQMSGRLRGELRALETCLERHTEMCSVDLLEQIRLKFRHVGDTDKVVQQLRDAVPPSMPSPPSTDWEPNRWLDWAVDEYLPARQWILEHKRKDLLTQCDSAAYEEWLWTAYPKLLYESDILLNGISGRVEDLLRHGFRVLWLMIDNLSVACLRPAIEEFREQGLFAQQDVEYRIALLPSVTSVSRDAALLGSLPRERPADIGGEFARRWEGTGGYPARIVENLREAEIAFSEGCLLCCVVWPNLDRASHEPGWSVSSRRDEIRAALRPLCSGAAELAVSLNEIGPSLVMVTSDHGATRIISDANRLQIPPFATDSDEPARRHGRFVRVSCLDAVDDVHWFLLQPKAFGLDSGYAVAKGQGFVERIPSGYTHGGLTPEETVVPVVILSPRETPRQQLTIFHSSSPIRLGTPQSIELTIRNPYAFNLRRLELVLPGTGYVATAAMIPPKTEAALGGEVLLPAKTAGESGTVNREYTISYELAGTERRDTGPLTLRIRHLYKAPQDIFEELS